MKAQPIAVTALMRYGALAMPAAFAGFPLYVLAPDYYATQFEIPLALMGIILLGLRLCDAAIDPVMGWLIDRLQTQLLWPLIVAASLLCLTIYGLFNVRAPSPAMWFALCMGGAVFAHSLITIMLGTFAVLWTQDQTEQTRIAAMRESFGLIGLIIAVSLPSILQQIFATPHIYGFYSVLLAAVMGMAVIFFIPLLHKTPQRNRALETAPLSPLAFLQDLPKATRHLLFVYGVSMFASSIPAVLVIFYVRDLLGAEHLIGVFLTLYFLAGAGATPLWTAASRKFGKYQTWCLTTGLAVCSFIGAFFLQTGDTTLYALICLLSGLALGADLTLAPSLLSDQIHAYAHQRYSGTYFALLSFTAKAGLALASVTALTFLDYAGFKPHSTNDAHSLLALSTSYALIPCLLKLLAAALLYLFFIRPPSGGHHVTV